ncbi:peptidylprolyl isomerase [Candidatus Kaiserbacteria bacterium]|nr:MAG: peptidylprolyl isomerase [Candidatus Kaiserbacteria bacterium]
MASIKQIAFVLGISLVLVAIIGWWVDKNNEKPALLLDTETQLAGPLTPEELVINNPDITNTMNRVAVFSTNKGTIEIELFEDKMPITTGNFIKLALENFYDGIKFHRVIDGFMIQAGDPNTKGNDILSYGSGGPGYTVQDEFVEDSLLSNVRGTIAMANTGQPNSGGSQFFINTVDNTGLDFNKEPFSSKHPVFGRVIKGLDIVDAISKVEVGQRDLPVEPVVIESIDIKAGE